LATPELDEVSKSNTVRSMYTMLPAKYDAFLYSSSI